uniref:Uncharacterized protein n=1 Tax=Fagus sylvatica TaxID=28930 RepID=A0A2N9HQR2_FAGSY
MRPEVWRREISSAWWLGVRSQIAVAAVVGWWLAARSAMVAGNRE